MLRVVEDHVIQHAIAQPRRPLRGRPDVVRTSRKGTRRPVRGRSAGQRHRPSRREEHAQHQLPPRHGPGAPPRWHDQSRREREEVRRSTGGTGNRRRRGRPRPARRPRRPGSGRASRRRARRPREAGWAGARGSSSPTSRGRHAWCRWRRWSMRSSVPRLFVRPPSGTASTPSRAPTVYGAAPEKRSRPIDVADTLDGPGATETPHAGLPARHWREQRASERSRRADYRAGARRSVEPPVIRATRAGLQLHVVVALDEVVVDLEARMPNVRRTPAPDRNGIEMVWSCHGNNDRRGWPHRRAQSAA